MINYKSIRDGGKSFWDHSHIESIVQHLSSEKGYSIDEILGAIQEVGFDSGDISEYIEDRQNRM